MLCLFRHDKRHVLFDKKWQVTCFICLDMIVTCYMCIDMKIDMFHLFKHDSDMLYVCLKMTSDMFYLLRHNSDTLYMYRHDNWHVIFASIQQVTCHICLDMRNYIFYLIRHDKWHV